MSKMAEFGCFICKKYYGITNTHNVTIHHLRTGVGMGQRKHNQFICLCVSHHMFGLEAIHGIGKKAWEEKFESELSLLEWYKEQEKERYVEWDEHGDKQSGFIDEYGDKDK